MSELILIGMILLKDWIPDKRHSGMTKLGSGNGVCRIFTSCIWLEIACANFVMPVRMYLISLFSSFRIGEHAGMTKWEVEIQLPYIY